MIRFSGTIFTIIVFSILISACSNKKLIEKKTLANAYVDILIVKEKYQTNSDSLIANQKKVFEKYGITKNAYEATLKSFKFDKDAWNDFFKDVYARIDTLKNRKKLLKKKQIHKDKKVGELNAISFPPKQ